MSEPSAAGERPGADLPRAEARSLETALRAKAAAIRAEQIKLLFGSGPLALAGHFLNGLILTVILWDVSSRPALLGWLAYTIGVASVRFLFVRWYWRRAPDPAESPRWGTLFIVGSTLSGLGWGLAAFLIFPEHSVPHQVILTLVVAGMGAGAVTLVAAVKEAFFGFTIPTFLPLILRLLTHAEPIENAMGVLVALFAGYMMFTGLKMHATITTSLSLRFENKDLIDDLDAQIAERMRSEEALRLSNERFELAAEGSREGLWEVSGPPDDPFNPQRPIYYSPRFKALLGFTDQEFPNVLGSWSSRLHPDDQPRVFAALQTHLARKAPYEVEYRLLTKGGEYRWYIARGQALWDETGRPVRMAGSLSDITERKRLEGLLLQHAEDLEQRVQKRTAQLAAANQALRSEVDDRRRAEDALRENERRIRMILETALEAVISMDANGKVLDWNPQAEKTFGWSRAEAIGRDLASMIIPQRYREAHRQGLRRFLEYGEGPILGSVVEMTALHRDRREFPVELTVTQVRMAGAWTFTAFVRDITNRRLLEERLRQGQKMEALGRLAGGVAHDFNNLMTVITGSCDLLLRRLGSDASAREHIERTMKAVDRGASLTRQLLAFSRRQVLTPKVLDLNAVVLRLKELLVRLIGEDVSMVTALDPALGRVRADQGQIEQVIMNLIVNARDAMTAGGRITITTRNIALAEGYAYGADVIPPGSYVSLEVADTGCGMDAETRAHIFEPFFTTKDPGKGTGLGLATVYGIVKESDGLIALASEPGRGSTFTLYLPRTEGAVEAPEPARPPAEPLRDSATILLVEDEDMVRSTVRELLKELGYTLLEAGDGPEALRVSADHAGPIHLLLTDMVMPGMSGVELAQRVTERRPDTKVLYMSGYTDKAVSHQELTPSGAAFLQKPITPDELARKVRAALGPPG